LLIDVYLSNVKRLFQKPLQIHLGKPAKTLKSDWPISAFQKEIFLKQHKLHVGVVAFAITNMELDYVPS